MRLVTSPTAWIEGTLEVEPLSTTTAPAASSATPADSRPSPAVFGLRPVATSTWSASSASPSERATRSLAPRFSIRVGRQPNRSSHAGASELVAQALAHVLVEAPEHVVGAHDFDHLGAEPGEQRGELDRDIAAADDQQPAGKGLEVEDLVGGNGVLEAGDRARRLGPRAGRDEDVPGARRSAAGEPDMMGVDQFGALLDQLDARLVEVGAIDRGQARDFALLGRHQRRPIETPRPDAPAEPFGVGKIVGEAARVDQQLLGHAAANDAGSADAEFLRDDDLRAMLGRDSRRPNPARTGADDEQVDVERHRANLSSASATLRPDARRDAIAV